MYAVENKIRVALYGHSLFLQGIAKSLEAAPWLEVVRVLPDTVDASLSEEAWDASMLAFDIRETLPRLMLALFKGAPNLILLALDPESDRLMVLSSQQERAVAVADLLKVIRREEMGGMGEAGTGRQRDKETNGTLKSERLTVNGVEAQESINMERR